MHPNLLNCHVYLKENQAIARAPNSDDLTFQTAWAEGQAMTPEEAIAFALDKDPGL